MQGTSLLLQPSSQNMIECSGRKLSNSRKSTWRIGRFAQWLLILVHVYRPRVASRSCLEAQFVDSGLFTQLAIQQPLARHTVLEVFLFIGFIP